MIMITGRFLKQLREKVGMTQEELAKKVGVSQAHIAKIETGKVDPRLSVVNRILQVLRNEQVILLKNIMTRKIISARPSDKLIRAAELIKEHGISQIPIIENGICVGTITEKDFIKHLDKDLATTKISEIMEPPLPIFPEDTPVRSISMLFEIYPAILVSEHSTGRIVGIVARSDLVGTE